MSAWQARLLQITTPEDAERELIRIGVDPGGITRMATKMQTRCVHLPGLQCRQANILKQEMLSLGGDAAVARGTVACSIKSTDVILIGTEKQLRALCSKLAPQPFGLPTLAADLSAVLSNSVNMRNIWRTSRRDLSLSRPLIMGILNVTPDSFSDGSRYLDPQRAVEKALEMVEQGADIIDIGGESSRPGAAAVDQALESARVVPVISALAGKVNCPISVDTWKSAVARDAMAAGAEIINDISGLTFDSSLADVAAETGAGVVLMHTRGRPDSMQRNTRYDDLLGQVIQGLRHSLLTAETAGIESIKIALDPGIGFGKDCDGNLEILRRLGEFKCLGQPLLLGTSRKGFIGKTLGREIGDRLYGTAATVAMAVAQGASILRVHDVAAMRDVADMTHAIMTRSDC